MTHVHILRNGSFANDSLFVIVPGVSSPERVTKARVELSIDKQKIFIENCKYFLSHNF